MALALLLRNTSRLSSGGFPQLVKTATSKRQFSQLLGKSTKNVAAYTKNKTNLELVKRSMSGDHSKLWPIEKAVSVLLLGVVPATFISPNCILDDIFAVLVVTHFHWGLEACVVDYVRPIIFGPVIPKLTMALLYLISIGTLGGLLYYNHHCIGIGCTGRRIWEIKK
ncbi:unnamed protein product [Acanthoscelides obtectus]|uniref:Succinate dehydrogenase [ubiquinone] cytochrome b small subunit n=1 Tax=Acanthoscelides obtectus TaxID=200917 RepID=A0A9P0PW65_ACAOB|nr:unnamed protein product [Acanthoscelides obtectus]CAK1646271.1 Succinate dehydrogenase [ubiquinone] cytochrome b small subunit, mitochondrial [Acanthoscelides obtectus]